MELKEFFWKSGQKVYKKKCKCGMWIAFVSNHCKSCAKIGSHNPFYGKRHKSESKKLMGPGDVKGDKNPNWKDGRCLFKKLCPECGKNEIRWESKLCRVCFGKSIAGEKNPAKKLEARIKISKKLGGSMNPSWRGGISFGLYGFEFNRKFKALIKERDGNRCRRCSDSKYLGPHHIDYDKKNNDPNNLITLCRSCNSSANSNRKYWKKFYEVKMHE